MKKTDRYQFNLIEKEDTFSPDSLNENTQKLEDRLDSLRAEAAESDAALEQRVQVLELRKMAIGTYVGNSETSMDTQTIEVGFTPAVVIVAAPCTMVVADTPFSTISIVPGGFKVGSTASGSGLNTKGTTFRYLALC